MILREGTFSRKNSGSCVQKVHLFICHSYFLDSYHLLRRSVQSRRLVWNPDSLRFTHFSFFMKLHSKLKLFCLQQTSGRGRIRTSTKLLPLDVDRESIPYVEGRDLFFPLRVIREWEARSVRHMLASSRAAGLDNWIALISPQRNVIYKLESSTNKEEAARGARRRASPSLA